jgi:Asp-tRNA(Asn)/Glu-tRNA(Gln) amidotransferase A subunit family amidase
MHAFGVQLVGKPFSEPILIAAAAAFEKARPVVEACVD